MKSFIDTYTKLYSALIEDIIASFPSLVGGTQKDYSRLLRSIESEGIGFITITHGLMDKAFINALSQKSLMGIESKLVRGFGSVSNHDVRPRYLHGLLSLVFSHDGTLLDVPDPQAILFIRAWLCLAKKAEIPCTPDRVNNTILEWKKNEHSLPDHRPDTWDSDIPHWRKLQGHPLFGDLPATSSFFGNEESVDEFRSEWHRYRRLVADITCSFGPLNLWAIRPKHGPGANADQKLGLKYEFPTWPAKLQSIFPWDFFASADLGYYRNNQGTPPQEIEVPSVMYAVPKTQTEPRLIAAEPIAHQWIQQGIRRWLEGRVAEHAHLSRSINFEDQRLSQRRATEGSLTGELATVDLSSASDLLSSRLVEYVFQDNHDLLDGLHACRSRLIKLPNGELHRMRKFAPMGSAVCFPIQTIVFTSLALFSIMLSRGWTSSQVLEKGTAEVQVFGDDIVIPVDSYPMLVRLLHSLRLRVNVNKSFASGNFREACGVDAFSGVDVTPVKVKKVYSRSDPSSLQSVVEASNNLFLKGLWRTSAALLETVPRGERKLIAVGMPGGGAVSLVSFCSAQASKEGLFTTSGIDGSHLKQVWDTEYQVWKHRALVVLSKNTMARSDGEAGLVQFFSEEPNPEEEYSSGQVVRTVPRKEARLVY